ncbi:class I SAM-dependent methyltransferase [Corynebacterium sp. CCM 8835]|uniref:Class I SAM-dependent methyltransferase n=1 Tax=Corynebacterium antarcticum TaxID=2800405 RepID=A0ABS1FNT1_9CORY|nr:class I SAM-dependent methyltransferase [Corynebacterium antarcticum]MCL0245119.1 class I SAM-dependent methyltransferase [Corynebacterium antarcticum]
MTSTADLYGDNVGATLATTVYSRATAGERYRIPGWHDDQAREVWERLVEVGRAAGSDPNELVLTGKSNVAGTVWRSMAMDARVRQFAAEHEGTEIQVVTLGIGLCNRASRLADLDAWWLGIDRTKVLELRSRLIPEDDTRLIDASVTEPGWIDGVDAAVPTVFVAEGLLMYLTLDDVTQILTDIGRHMSAPARFICDSHHASIIRRPTRSQITRRTGAVYTFGIEDSRHLAALAPGWRAVGDDDTCSPIGFGMRIASGVFRMLRGGVLYGIKTIELPNHG